MLQSRHMACQSPCDRRQSLAHCAQCGPCSDACGLRSGASGSRPRDQGGRCHDQFAISILLLAGLSALALAAPGRSAGTQLQRRRSAARRRARSRTPTTDTIIVTGTRRTDRTVADSPVPIDVISGEALTNTGLTETNKILNQLVPSFNFPQPSIADGTDVLRPATLRGLSPDQTLVLVNGKRRHVSALLNINGTVGRGSAAVDMNLIPALAIERIEVLRDGASSQYGSDAIAGVINVQPQDAPTMAAARSPATANITPRSTDVARFNGLQTNAGGQPILDSDRQPLFPRQHRRRAQGARRRDHHHRRQHRAAGRQAATSTSPPNIATATRPTAPATTCGPIICRPTAPGVRPARADLRPAQFRFGDAKTEDFNFFVNAGIAGRRCAKPMRSAPTASATASAPPITARPTAPPTATIRSCRPATTPNNANFVALTPDGFLPLIDTDSRIMRARRRPRRVGRLEDRFVARLRPQPVRLYRSATASTPRSGPPARRRSTPAGCATARWLANLDFSKQFEVGLASPLSVGARRRISRREFRDHAGRAPILRQRAVVPRRDPQHHAANCTVEGGVYVGTDVCSFPGRAAGAGAQGFPGIPPASATDESRHSFAAYVELDADLFENFTATLAGRYEHFSDFGDTVNGKLALRYEFVPGLAVRGSISNGFRAPSLHQQFFTTTSTNFISGVPVDISTVAGRQPGRPRAWSAGARAGKIGQHQRRRDCQAAPRAQPDRRFLPDQDQGPHRADRESRPAVGQPRSTDRRSARRAIGTILDANGFQTIGAARFFINGLDTTTRGLDVIGYLSLDPGQLRQLDAHRGL